MEDLQKLLLDLVARSFDTSKEDMLKDIKKKFEDGPDTEELDEWRKENVKPW